MTQALIKLDAVTRALAEANTVPEVKEIMSIAAAAKTYARKANLGLEAFNYAAKKHLDSQRKAGELTKQLERGDILTTGGPGRGNKNVSTDGHVLSEYAQVLKETETSRGTANRWQKIADLSDEAYEQYTDIGQATQKRIELSSAYVLNIIKKLNRNGKEQSEPVIITPQDANNCQLTIGDFTIDDCGLLPNSIDFIITDPPYPKEYLSLYEVLAQKAANLLKPGGSLLAMAGQSYIPEIFKLMTPYLNYHWMLTYLTPGGQSPQIWTRKINTFWKPVLWFVKGDYNGPWIGDVLKSDVNDNDKRYHEWGQSESGFVDLIERFTKPGDLILDPFCGGGTTGYVALKLNRRFIGIDKNSDAISDSRVRIYGN